MAPAGNGEEAMFCSLRATNVFARKYIGRGLAFLKLVKLCLNHDVRFVSLVTFSKFMDADVMMESTKAQAAERRGCTKETLTKMEI